eukprot:6552483-Alexandrium_andersonii.AAC.1
MSIRESSEPCAGTSIHRYADLAMPASMCRCADILIHEPCVHARVHQWPSAWVVGMSGHRVSMFLHEL